MRCLRKVALLCLAALFLTAHLALAAESLFPRPTALSAPAAPSRAPDMDLSNLHGGTLKSADTKGKVVIIRFWATW